MMGLNTNDEVEALQLLARVGKRIRGCCAALTMLQDVCHGQASDKGFWASKNDAEKIALMHSELSEALEALRDGNPDSEHIPEVTAVEEELADVVIRILDFCGRHRFDLGDAVLLKLVNNASRPQLHGKKF